MSAKKARAARQAANPEGFVKPAKTPTPLFERTMSSREVNRVVVEAQRQMRERANAHLKMKVS